MIASSGGSKIGGKLLPIFDPELATGFGQSPGPIFLCCQLLLAEARNLQLQPGDLLEAVQGKQAGSRRSAEAVLPLFF